MTDVLRSAPPERALLVLHSGRLHPRWSRWSVVAQPRAVLRHQRGRTIWQSLDGACNSAPGFSNEPVADLEWLDRQIASAGSARGDRPASPTAGMPRGGWYGYLSYEFGHAIEPRARHANPWHRKGGSWPLYEWFWCPEVFACDQQTGDWFAGTLDRVHPLSPDDLAARLGISRWSTGSEAQSAGVTAWDRTEHTDRVASRVARTIEYIRAGDIFQANISRKFEATLRVPPRELAAIAWERAPNWYSAYIECACDRQLLSLSPELFLDVDRASHTIVSRPLKGTIEAARGQSALEASGKDEAELNMIIDLMRNDLGRICAYGSVRVTQGRSIESHPTVHHGVATIEGRLRERIGLSDIVRATFPAGSITGAPKIRAMQIIDELEPFSRGPYCGSIGYVGADLIRLNVAIRTICIEGSVATYAAGAGVVADSHPDRECEEMIAKTAVVRALARTPAPNADSPARDPQVPIHG